MKVTCDGIAAAKAIVSAAANAAEQDSRQSGRRNVDIQRAAGATAHTRIGEPRRIGHTGGVLGTRHSRGNADGSFAVNPFTISEAIYISKKPQDMRAGVQRLASIVAAGFERNPMNGSLHCFVSRDCETTKLLCASSSTTGACTMCVSSRAAGFSPISG